MVRVWLGRAAWAALGTWRAGPHSALSPIVTEPVTSQGSHFVLQAKRNLFWTSGQKLGLWDGLRTKAQAPRQASLGLNPCKMLWDHNPLAGSEIMNFIYTTTNSKYISALEISLLPNPLAGRK